MFATIAAAAANDGGIAGVAYSGVSVMPVQVLSADGTGTDADIVSGLVWAADHGADVALLAFSNPGESPALQAAVNYAWSHGVVVVAAAGNDGSSTPMYPAGLAKVVGVGATDQTDTVASFSNTSDAVFITAPGVDIAASDTSGMTSISGTSASAAIVAGSAALIRAAESGASNATIVGRIARDAAPVTNGGGNGRIDLARAIDDDSTDGVDARWRARWRWSNRGPLRRASSRNLVLPERRVDHRGQQRDNDAELPAPLQPHELVRIRGRHGPLLDQQWQRHRWVVVQHAGVDYINVSNQQYSSGSEPNSSFDVNIPITICGDTNFESNETFNLTLSSASSGTSISSSSGTGGTAVGTINNDDAGTPTKLAVTSVNGGSHPVAGQPFSVVVQSQTAGGTATPVTTDTGVQLSLATGSGTLGATLTGTILAGQSSVTIAGATYTKAESGVSITATQTSGTPALSSGTSAPFVVDSGPASQLAIISINGGTTPTAYSPFGVTHAVAGHPGQPGTGDGSRRRSRSRRWATRIASTSGHAAFRQHVTSRSS